MGTDNNEVKKKSHCKRLIADPISNFI